MPILGTSSVITPIPMKHIFSTRGWGNFAGMDLGAAEQRITRFAQLGENLAKLLPRQSRRKPGTRAPPLTRAYPPLSRILDPGFRREERSLGFSCETGIADVPDDQGHPRGVWGVMRPAPIPVCTSRQKPPHLPHEGVELVVVDPVSRFFDQRDARRFEVLRAAVFFGVRGPAVAAIDEQRRTGNRRP